MKKIISIRQKHLRCKGGGGGGSSRGGNTGGGQPKVEPTAKKRGRNQVKSENGSVKERRAKAKASGIKGTHNMNHEHLKKLGY